MRWVGSVLAVAVLLACRPALSDDTYELTIYDTTRYDELMRQSHTLRVAGIALLASGLGLSATGGLLVGLEFASQCSDCNDPPDLVYAGVAVGSVGLAAVVLGAVLMGVGAKRGREASAMTSGLVLPFATAGPDGLVLGLHAAF
jgi:uncharacterized membrane protein